MKKFPTILYTLLLLIPSYSLASESVLDTLKSYSGGQQELIASIPSVQTENLKMVDSPMRGLSGEALFNQLSAQYQPSRTHQFSYGGARVYMYGTADQINCGGRMGINTFYSQVCAYGNGGDGNSYKEQGDQNRDGVVDKIINAEHLWPQSFFGKATPMVADLHHLQSTFSTPNGRRSNYPFCETRNARYSTSSGSKLASDRNCFEPTDDVKGNVARAMLYFVTVYHNRSICQGACNYKEFWKDNVDMFLRWNRQDPPDEVEKYRNEMIFRYQGNRNPYVDDYTLADRIGADVFKKY